MQPVTDAKLALEPECSFTELRAEKRDRYDRKGFNLPDHTTGSPLASVDDAKLPSMFTSSININSSYKPEVSMHDV